MTLDEKREYEHYGIVNIFASKRELEDIKKYYPNVLIKKIGTGTCEYKLISESKMKEINEYIYYQKIKNMLDNYRLSKQLYNNAKDAFTWWYKELNYKEKYILLCNENDIWKNFNHEFKLNFLRQIETEKYKI